MAGRGINRAMASPRERPPGEGELLEGAGAAPKAVKLRRRAERVVLGFTVGHPQTTTTQRMDVERYAQGDAGGELWWWTVGPEMQGQILYFLTIVP